MAQTTPTTRGPLARLLDLFSSIWLGVVLLTILFVYSSVGSALIFVREQWFEMTEFEWFIWWPFNLLCFLICVNIVVATLRRIPFNALRLGVWMIHGGILVLALGSVYYFSTKFEGDTPIIRRQLLIITPDSEPTSIPAIPGNTATVGGYTFQVRDIDPRWELLSGDDAGTRAYSVNVMVGTPDGESFVRQLIDGFPQYTEDLIRTDDATQPFQRAVRVTGERLYNTSIQLALDYEPQRDMFLMHSKALYLREVGQRDWVMRPIRTGPLKFHEIVQRLASRVTDTVDAPISPLPRYKDHIPSTADVWLSEPERFVPRELSIPVPPAASNDPLDDAEFVISGYTRFADYETRRIASGNELAPFARIELRRLSDGAIESHNLVAFDTDRRTSDDGMLALRWIDDTSEIESLSEFRHPRLHVTVPAEENNTDEPIEFDVEVTETLDSNPDLAFTEIDGTDYAYRVEVFEDNFMFSGEQRVSFASIEIRKGDRSYRRWVFDEPSFNRDMPLTNEDGMAIDQALDTDTGIAFRYTPGIRPVPVTIVAGPSPDDLGLLASIGGETSFTPIEPRQRVSLTDNIEMRVQMYSAYSRTETRPGILPRRQRDRQFEANLSMVRVQVPGAADDEPIWVAYNHYPFIDDNHSLRRFAYRPQTITLADGRQIEIMLSRQRKSLPHTLLLDTFEVVPRIGGFTGEDSSIRDWRSVIRFITDDGEITDQYRIETNEPASFEDLWYFQASWDPPMEPRFPGDPPSAGLNYTVLGVGNRNGVYIQLLGCGIAVFGMIYTFYIKPMIRRRRRRELLEVRADISEAELKRIEAGL